MRPFRLLLVLLAGALSTPAWSALVAVSSYSATPGDGRPQGSYDYWDETGFQLTDGIQGVDNWAADLGNGPAYEWVGWYFSNPSFTFHFPAVVTLDKVLIGFAHADSIYLPGSVAIGGSTFSLGGNEVPLGTRGTLEFNGLWTGNSLTVTLTRSSSWLFVDEFQFSAVPEPACGLPLGLVLFGAGVCRRRSPRQQSNGN